MVAHGSSPRVRDEPSEAAGLGQPRMGPQSKDSRARLLDLVGGQARSEEASETARGKSTRCKCLRQRTQNAEETAECEITSNPGPARSGPERGSIPLTNGGTMSAHSTVRRPRTGSTDHRDRRASGPRCARCGGEARRGPDGSGSIRSVPGRGPRPGSWSRHPSPAAIRFEMLAGLELENRPEV